jgi:hypothetical protein
VCPCLCLCMCLYLCLCLCLCLHLCLHLCMYLCLLLCLCVCSTLSTYEVIQQPHLRCDPLARVQPQHGLHQVAWYIGGFIMLCGIGVVYKVGLIGCVVQKKWV